MISPRWPLAVIDFEASGLGPTTYPIEVGVAVWPGPKERLSVWSRLIRPDPLWVRDMDWFELSQHVHGIAPRDLMVGETPLEIMQELNRRLAHVGYAHCDGGKHDLHWLTTLRVAAGLRADFTLGSLRSAIPKAVDDDWIRMHDWMRQNPPPHRAGPDVENIVGGIAHACGLTMPIVDRS